METKLLIGSLVFIGSISYLSFIRSRLIPNTISRLRKGFYPYPNALKKYDNFRIWREGEILFLQRIITTHLSHSKYYVITGRKGAGKTTMMEILIHRLKNTRGIIYVKAERTPNLKIFNQDLANAVDFNLIEKGLTDGSILTNIWSGLSRRDSEALFEFVTILNHIEAAAKRFHHEEDFVKPILILDHITYLAENNPQALHALQAKAKYWADHDILTVIFVGTDGMVPLILSQHSDSTRLDFIEVQGMSDDEAVAFLNEEFNKPRKTGDPMVEAELMRIAKANIMNFYKKNIQLFKKPGGTIDEQEMIKSVFSYLVKNYTGGNFMDNMKCVEELREGHTIQYLEEYFHRKVYMNLLTAGLLFEPPYDPEKVYILRSMKKIYLSPTKSIPFKEFRIGVDEKKTIDYLSKNVFLYNKDTGTVKFLSPAFVKYIEKELYHLNEALRHVPDKDKPRLILRFQYLIVQKKKKDNIYSNIIIFILLLFLLF